MEDIRDPFCTLCPMHQEAEGDDRCVMGIGPAYSKIMVVTKFPAKYETIAKLLSDVGLEEDFYLTSAIKCRTWSMDPDKSDVKTCKRYLDAEIERVNPEWILSFGNEALTATTGHSGIMKHRGKVYPRKDGRAKVMGTLSPSAVKISPGYEKGFYGDLRLFASLVTGKADEKWRKVPYRRVHNKADLRELVQALKNAHGVAFDIEGNGFDEWRPDSRMISIAFTLWDKNSTDPEIVWVLPLYHPESPFIRLWRQILRVIGRYLRKIPVRVAHNAKFDCRWLIEFGALISATFDTMLAAHLVDENRSKALESLGREELGIPTWKIPNHDLINQPLPTVLKYNGQDTLVTARLYFALRKEIEAQPNLNRIFQKIMMPASRVITEVERSGIWIDRPKLHENWKIAEEKLENIEAQLMEWVPDETPYLVNFNPSKFLLWWLFEYLGLPVLEISPKTGLPSLAEKVKFKLRPYHPVIDLLLERGMWYKYVSSFFSAYDELMDDLDRIHTTYKLTGTVTGRLSSGKADEEKVQAKPQRGVNLQQVPRNLFVRRLFGAAPGYVFVSADYSQVEFRIAAMMANAESVFQIYARGEDVHMIMAMQLTGKPKEQITKEERKRAKWVNFGFIYGMSWRTFIDTVWRGYQIKITEEEAKKARRTFFQTFPEFARWHEEQKKFARENGYVSSLIGRIRHLPNIRSNSASVRNEAERQAINSPVQSLASDLTLLSVIRIDEQAKRCGLDMRVLGTVHDEALYEIAEADLPEALPLIHSTMQELPIDKIFGINITVPLIANIKCSKHWDTDENGEELKELSEERIYDYAA
ncbi:MAG: DNA polymerase [Pseudonocardiaceae bacterium]